MRNPIESKSLMEFLGTALGAFIEIMIPVLVLAYIAVGIMFVASRGSAEKLALAKSAFLYTTVGTAILLGAWALAQILNNTISTLQ